MNKRAKKTKKASPKRRSTKNKEKYPAEKQLVPKDEAPNWSRSRKAFLYALLVLAAALSAPAQFKNFLFVSSLLFAGFGVRAAWPRFVNGYLAPQPRAGIGLAITGISCLWIIAQPFTLLPHTAYFTGVWLTCRKQARPWVFTLDYLLLFAYYGNEHPAISCLALVSLLLMLLNGGHIKHMGERISRLTEGEVAVSWLLGPGIVGVHVLRAWWDQAQAHPDIWDRITHFHWPHLHFGEGIAFAIMGILAAAGIATDSLSKVLDILTQVILRITGSQRTTKTLVSFSTFSVGPVASEAPAAAVTNTMIQRLATQITHEGFKHKFKIILICAAALSLSAGVLPVAAPPVAVIWLELTTIMGWGMFHLFLFTGILCLTAKLFFGWQLSYYLDDIVKAPLEWLKRTECLVLLQFVLLIICHVFLVDLFGPQFRIALYGWDFLLCTYVIVKKIGHEPWMPLTIGLLIITIHLNAAEGSLFVKMGAEFLRFTEMPLWLVVVTAGTFSFFVSVAVDNAATTKAMVGIALLILEPVGAIEVLNAATVQQLPAAQQVAVLSATALIISVIVQSLMAGVASIIANPVVNVLFASVYNISHKEWIWNALPYSIGCFIVGQLYSLFAAYVLLPWYLGL